MNADDPRHGTDRQPASERVAGCPCDHCELARRIWRRNRKLKVLGKPRLLSAAHVTRHIERLIENGWSASKIATSAGVAPSTISALRHGHARQITARNAAALMAVTGSPLNFSVPAEPTIRRLKALAAIGWPIRQTCVRAGLHERYGALAMGKGRRRVRSDVADAIARVYDELCMSPAPDTATSRHCRAVAQNAGWVPPLGWLNIDDLDEQPTDWQYRPRKIQLGQDFDPVVVMRLLEGDRVPSTAAERAEALAQWVADGGSESELCRWHGWRPGRYGSLRLVDEGVA